MKEQRVYRADGSLVCEACGQPYRKHPTEDHSWAGAAEEVAVLRRICNGDLVKT